MEFYQEPSGAITIAVGDFLLSTSDDLSKVWIVVMLMGDDQTICFTSSDRVVKDSFYFTTYALGPVPNDIKGVVTTLSAIAIAQDTDDWLEVPRALWPGVAGFINSHVY
jgi:hypothetical protein